MYWPKKKRSRKPKVKKATGLMPTGIRHQCDECKAIRFVSFRDLSLAAKPRCYRCGCTRLEIVEGASPTASPSMTRMMKEAGGPPPR